MMEDYAPEELSVMLCRMVYLTYTRFKNSLVGNQISDISPLANLTSLMGLDLESNHISDIAPLVENEGLATGDTVYLTDNPLSDDSIHIYIPELEARGVTVDY